MDAFDGLHPRENNLYLKVLQYNHWNQDITGPFSKFSFAEYLPHGDKPGKWTRAYKTLIMCRRGWHVTDEYNLDYWLSDAGDDETYVVQVRGTHKWVPEKIVVSQIRFICKVTRGRKGYSKREIANAYNKALRILRDEEN